MPDYNSLQTLLRLSSPSNLTSTNDPWLVGRQNDIYSGLDAWVPDADSETFRAAQDEGMTTDQYGVRHQASVRPRTGMRADMLALLKQKLGLGAIQSSRDLNSELQKIALKGNIEGQSQERQAEIYADRARLQSELADERNANAAARAFDRTQYTQDNINDRAAASLNARGTKSTPPTQGQTKALSASRDYYNSTQAKMARGLHLGSGGREEYINNLEDVLQRDGVYGWTSQLVKDARANNASTAEAMARAEAEGVTLSPYQQEYLQLMIGR